MIAQVQGRLVEKNLTDVVIDCQGVGYFLNISLHTYSQIPDQENIRLYTQLFGSRGCHDLIRFASKKSVRYLIFYFLYLVLALVPPGPCYLP